MFYTRFPFQSFLILAILASFWVKNESCQLKAMKGKVFSIFIKRVSCVGNEKWDIERGYEIRCILSQLSVICSFGGTLKFYAIAPVRITPM